MHVVGAKDKAAIVNSLSGITSKWKSKPVTIPEFKQPAASKKATVYFYDVPDAKQSVIRFGYLALAAKDKDYYPATVMNYILGGGGFASQLTRLREEKGYTYGIGSGFSGSNTPGPFTIASSVRTNVTLESAQLVKEILENYGKNYSENDLATTKSFLVKSNSRAFETAGAKLNMLENISKYGWKNDYLKEREKIVNNMTVDQIRALSGKYLDINKMTWLIVGDAKTQLPRLKELGLGEPVLLNEKKAF